jgi:hypothetical protein
MCGRVRCQACNAVDCKSAILASAESTGMLWDKVVNCIDFEVKRQSY